MVERQQGAVSSCLRLREVVSHPKAGALCQQSWRQTGPRQRPVAGAHTRMATRVHTTALPILSLRTGQPCRRRDGAWCGAHGLPCCAPWRPACRVAALRPVARGPCPCAGAECGMRGAARSRRVARARMTWRVLWCAVAGRVASRPRGTQVCWLERVARRGNLPTECDSMAALPRDAAADALLCPLYPQNNAHRAVLDLSGASPAAPPARRAETLTDTPSSPRPVGLLSGRGGRWCRPELARDGRASRRPRRTPRRRPRLLERAVFRAAGLPGPVLVQQTRDAAALGG